MRPSDERGSATLWALVWLTVLVSVAQIGLLVTALVARQHHVDAAADMTALSAAARLHRGEDPCAAARRVAAAHKVTLTTCQVEGPDVRVAVGAGVGLPFGLSVELSGVARAGP